MPTNRLATSHKELKKQGNAGLSKTRKPKKTRKKKAPSAPSTPSTSSGRGGSGRVVGKTFKKKPRPEQVHEKKVQARPSPERLEKEKTLIIWSGVTFFMLLIGFFWLYSTNSILGQSRTREPDNGIEDLIDEWNGLGKQIEENLGQINSEIEKLQALSTAGTGTPGQVAGTSTRHNPADKPALPPSEGQAVIEKLKMELMENNNQ